VPADRVRVIPQALDPTPYHRTMEAKALAWGDDAGDRFLIGYVGRLVPEKGVDILLRALALLPERFVLAVIGGGREAEALRALAGELGVGEGVRWLGRVERSLIPRYLSSFDALVLPSRSIPNWQEQFGAVLVEGMLCETPLVGSSSGAIPEVMGDAGLVFTEENPQSLADCLTRLAADPSLAATLGSSGRRRALSEFTIEVQVGRLRGMFEEAVTRKRLTASSRGRR
jgi:glycosyltransferase involved in cell wall biosynthesis